MNFTLFEKLTELLKQRKHEEAIVYAEQELREIPSTDFHKILNRDLLHLTGDLGKHLQEFDKSTRIVLKKKLGLFKYLFRSAQKRKPAAYYCEMNGFTINYDRWYIDLFSFENYNTQDWYWLSDFYDVWGDFTITGFEDIQLVFQDVHENNRFDEPNIIKAYEVCELLVILRLQELFHETYKSTKAEWTNIPMFVSAHDYYFIDRVNE